MNGIVTGSARRQRGGVEVEKKLPARHGTVHGSRGLSRVSPTPAMTDEVAGRNRDEDEKHDAEAHGLPERGAMVEQQHNAAARQADKEALQGQFQRSRISVHGPSQGNGRRSLPATRRAGPRGKSTREKLSRRGPAKSSGWLTGTPVQRLGRRPAWRLQPPQKEEPLEGTGVALSKPFEFPP